MQESPVEPEHSLYKEMMRIAKAEVGDLRLGTVMAYFAGEDLGEFVLQNVVAASIVKRFPREYVMGIFLNDPAWKEFVVACNPYVLGAMSTTAESEDSILLDWFDVGAYAPVKCPDPTWYDRGFHQPGLMLLPNMLSVNAARLDGLAEAPPQFRLPSTDEASLLTQLEGLGLDPARWFACVHMDGAGSGNAEDSRTTTDPEPYLALIRHIIERQGGQVVRVGDAGRMPAAEGLIDLSPLTDRFAEHVAAISRARYFIGTESGAVALASAFRIPCAAVNALQYANLVWNREDVVLAKRLRLTDGTVLGTREIYERGWLESPLPQDVECLDNTPEQLIAVAEHLLAATSDCPAWRVPAAEVPAQEIGSLTFPLRMCKDPLVTFWD